MHKVGCSKCNGTGYKGRISIHEILPIDKPVRRMIAENKTSEEIKDYARNTLEMLTLKGREDHVTEDIGLGFDYKRISEDQFEKRIKFKEADNIRIISEDVYKELDDKYGYTPYDFSAPSIGPKLSAGAATFIAIIIIM